MPALSVGEISHAERAEEATNLRVRARTRRANYFCARRKRAGPRLIRTAAWSRGSLHTTKTSNDPPESQRRAGFSFHTHIYTLRQSKSGRRDASYRTTFAYTALLGYLLAWRAVTYLNGATKTASTAGCPNKSRACPIYSCFSTIIFLIFI